MLVISEPRKTVQFNGSDQKEPANGSRQQSPESNRERTQQWGE